MHFGCAPRVNDFLLFWCDFVTALVPGLYEFCEKIFVECCVEVVVNFVVDNDVNLWCFESDGGHWFVVNPDYLGLFIVVLDNDLSRFDEVVVVEGFHNCFHGLVLIHGHSVFVFFEPDKEMGVVFALYRDVVPFMVPCVIEKSFENCISVRGLMEFNY